MKNFFNVLMVLMLLQLLACNNNNNNNTDNTDKNDNSETENVSLVVQTEYLGDSSIKVEYQYDTISKKKHGYFKEYSEGVLLSEKNYKMDVLHGTEIFYFPDGKNIDGQFEYVDGVHQGDFTYYFESGQVKQKGTYVDGKLEGNLLGYYENGTLKEEVLHKEGVTNGPFKEYNEAGVLVAEGNFTTKGDNETLEHGLLKLYDESGAMNKKMMCKEGQCCTIWTVEDGDISPSSKLCEAIIESMKEAEELQ